MATWRFEGVALDSGETMSWRAGSGDEQRLPGRFAITGLVDAHCHLTVDFDADGPLLRGRDLAEKRLEEMTDLGVTAVRDVGGARDVTLDLTRSLRPGVPRVEAAGRFFSSPDHYFPRMFTPVPADELVAAVAAEIDAGARWVKLIADFTPMVDRGPMEPTYDLDTLAATIRTAHERGARVAAHAQTSYASDLIALGVDSIEHGSELTSSDLEPLVAHGCAWTPTLSASYRFTDGEHQVEGEFAERMCELIPRAVEAGVKVLAGTDAAGTMLTEVQLLVRHGLTVEQALRAATRDTSDFLGLDASQDIVTYEHDPRSDPEILGHPAAVVIRGERVR